MPNDAITPFILAVPQADLEDLNRRIDQTRWTPKSSFITGADLPVDGGAVAV